MYRSLTKGAASAAIVAASILGMVGAGVAAGFKTTDLVANKSPLTDANGVVHTPALVDTNLVNPWGVGETTSSQFWISDNGSNLSTTYVTTTPPIALGTRVVSIPSPTNPLGGGTPTGVVFNIDATATDFQIQGVNASGVTTKARAAFIFATEDGTIVGWNPTIGPTTATVGTAGIIAVNNSNNPVVGMGAVYKGLAIATDGTGKALLYVTNFRAGTVEVYDKTFTRVVSAGAFADPQLPRGYAPFNIVPVGGKLVVTYAVQDAAKHDDVGGESHGIVNTFDLGGKSLHRLIQHGQLNSPWGVTLAPSTFGPLAGALLVGNFGNGHIDAYNATTGVFIDKVRDAYGQAIVIDGLWSLSVGNDGSGGKSNTVYFTAGTNGESDGLFGSLSPN